MTDKIVDARQLATASSWPCPTNSANVWAIWATGTAERITNVIFSSVGVGRKATRRKTINGKANCFTPITKYLRGSRKIFFKSIEPNLMPSAIMHNGADILARIVTQLFNGSPAVGIETILRSKKYKTKEMAKPIVAGLRRILFIEMYFLSFVMMKQATVKPIKYITER